MSDKTVFKSSDLFFWMGCFDTPENPSGFPNTFPFTLEIGGRSGLLSQRPSPELAALLDQTYQYGSTVGNAMDDSPLGNAYCTDFLTFCEAHLQHGQNLLEIGAGRGYLASRLTKAGYRVDALEPGNINKPYWDKYEAKIIQAMFPSPQTPGPYDAILFYGVLEHISDYGTFLRHVRDHLSEKGVALLSVPDCELEIRQGDPSMLLHEHYHYFTRETLRRALEENGFTAEVTPSAYGRCLYAAIRKNPAAPAIVEPNTQDIEMFKRFGERCAAHKATIAKKLEKTLTHGSLGVYIPARILSYLPYDADVRFFDDSEDLHGKYYPPFTARIENRGDLQNNPPDTLWIMSKTFGHKIKQALQENGYTGTILLADDVFSPEDR